MADNGDLREDLKIPDGELGTQLRADYDAGKELLVIIIKLFLFYFKAWYFNLILFFCLF